MRPHTRIRLQASGALDRSEQQLPYNLMPALVLEYLLGNRERVVQRLSESFWRYYALYWFSYHAGLLILSTNPADTLSNQANTHIIHIAGNASTPLANKDAAAAALDNTANTCNGNLMLRPCYLLSSMLHPVFVLEHAFTALRSGINSKSKPNPINPTKLVDYEFFRGRQRYI